MSGGRLRNGLATCALLALLACQKDDPAGVERAGKGSAGGSVATDASPAAAVSALGPGSSGSAGGGGEKAGTAAAKTFEGKYVVAPATYYVPEHKDWSAVKQVKSDDASMVGPGTMTLAIDGAGRVSGTIDGGPAKGATLDGSMEGSHVRATIRRVDPADQGLSGVLEAETKNGALEGEMRLATANASVVRKATLSLAAK